MSSKRPAEGSSQQNPSKKVHFEPCRIGAVSTQEELDTKVLQFQNRKLSERLEQRQRAEADLRQRIEQLEKRQTSDEAVLCVVNRYWNQLNEDLRILLQRFDSETSDEYESRNENEATTSFLALLGQWDREELEEKLAQRVQVSTRAVAKVLQAFDRIVQRNHKVMLALKGTEGDEEVPSLDDAVRQANVELQSENKNLHLLVTGLHERTHQTNLKFSEMNDKLAALEIANAELKNHIEDVEYDLSKTKQREEKLDKHLSESLAKLRNYSVSTEADGTTTGPQQPVSAITQAKMDDLQKDLEEQKELASNRLMELETLNADHKEALKLVEKLKMDLQCLPESVVVETTEYKCLQSQFSVLYNESMQLKTVLEDTRLLMATSKTQHLRQIEEMEGEELMLQKKLKTELIQTEDSLSQVRKEYEMLRVEFEQNLAANEQTGPINREMRHLITSLQNHNHQLKGDVQRFKKKLKEISVENAKLQPLASKVGEGTVGGGGSSSVPSVKQEPVDGSSSSSNPVVKEECIKKEKEEERDDDGLDIREKGKTDAEIIRELKTQLKKSQEAQKELKLLLDMYKGAPKELRDKAQLMSAEKKARADAEEARAQLRRSQDCERRERRKLADEEALRRIRALEEQLQQAQKSLASTKQEEEVLLNEMDTTGQAFEDMQEQNVRLTQQLREKDDANFKLMSERIKSNQVQKLMREEKVNLTEQCCILKKQVEAQNNVVRKLEEKERLLQTTVATLEKELSLRQQSCEMQKRKSVESAQSAADLRLHLEKYLSHLKEVQATVADKTALLQQEAFKTRRLQEDIISLRKKVERGKKFELASTADEVLAEEIREYKEQLTCPSCKVKRKDAVLTKCFHVFCFDCLKTRYETRQRKCPKCNANFGANDFHRLYLA